MITGQIKNQIDQIWETYSAFANTRDGVILLGNSEDKTNPLEGNRVMVLMIKTDLFSFN